MRRPRGGQSGVVSLFKGVDSATSPGLYFEIRGDGGISHRRHPNYRSPCSRQHRGRHGVGAGAGERLQEKMDEDPYGGASCTPHLGRGLSRLRLKLKLEPKLELKLRLELRLRLE